MRRQGTVIEIKDPAAAEHRKNSRESKLSLRKTDSPLKVIGEPVSVPEVLEIYSID